MIRLLNVLALGALIASATWAYSVKYETILVAEKLKKREAELHRERDAVTILQAEWQLLNRPARLQALAKPESGMQQISARQVAKPADIPHGAPATADPLDQLLTGSLPATDNPAKGAPKNAGTTPVTKRPVPGAAKTGTTPSNAARTSPRNPAVATAAPVRITPPARIGPPPGAEERAGGNPLTGLLKKMFQ